MSAQAYTFQSRGIPSQGVVTNGVTYVTVTIPELLDEQGNSVLPGRNIHLTELETELLINALSSKVVNLHRQVHDNAAEAI